MRCGGRCLEAVLRRVRGQALPGGDLVVVQPQGRHGQYNPVWSKNSCGLSLVVFEQATKPFTRLNRAVIPALWPGLWKEQPIALALMIALLVVMVHILVEHMPQRAFAEQKHL